VGARDVCLQVSLDMCVRATSRVSLNISIQVSLEMCESLHSAPVPINKSVFDHVPIPLLPECYMATCLHVRVRLEKRGWGSVGRG